MCGGCKMNKFLWKAWYKLKYLWDWGMGGATDAVTHPYKDNPPPDIGEQPYKDDPKPHSKWR